MKRRRAPGTGSIRRPKDGQWEGSITVGTTAAGHPRRRFVYGRTQAEVVTKLADLTGRIATGTLPPPATITVAAYLRWWLGVVERSTRPKTADSYRGIVEQHLVPALGARRLQQLTTTHIEECLRQVKAHRVLPGRAGAPPSVTVREPSPRLVAYVLAVLSIALRQAVRAGLLSRNPAAAVRGPRATRRDPVVWGPAAVRSFILAARGSRYAVLHYLALATGMRLGELLGLQWDAVDLESGELRVRWAVTNIRGQVVVGEPKTPRARRTIALPPAAVAALRIQRETWKAERDRRAPATENMA